MGAGAEGGNVALSAGTGNANAGWSGWEIKSSTLATTGTLQMRVIAPVERVDNDPTLTNAKWLCAVNLHSQRNATGI